MARENLRQKLASEWDSHTESMPSGKVAGEGPSRQRKQQVRRPGKRKGPGMPKGQRKGQCINIRSGVKGTEWCLFLKRCWFGTGGRKTVLWDLNFEISTWWIMYLLGFFLVLRDRNLNQTKLRENQVDRGGFCWTIFHGSRKNTVWGCRSRGSCVTSSLCFCVPGGVSLS